MFQFGNLAKISEDYQHVVSNWPVALAFYVTRSFLGIGEEAVSDSYTATLPVVHASGKVRFLSLATCISRGSVVHEQPKPSLLLAVERFTVQRRRPVPQGLNRYVPLSTPPDPHLTSLTASTRDAGGNFEHKAWALEFQGFIIVNPSGVCRPYHHTIVKSVTNTVFKYVGRCRGRP